MAGPGVVAFDGKRWALRAGEHVDEAWDRLVGEHLLDELETEVSHGLGYLAIMSRKNSKTGRVDVWTSSLPLGQVQVSGSAAFVNGERVGSGSNYLTPGAHWNAVRDSIGPHANPREVPTTRADENRAPVLAILTETLRYLPDVPTTVTLADALFASAQLADERTVAYALPTVLMTLTLELELWPIQQFRGGPALPLRVRAGNEQLEGALLLAGPSEPMPLCIRPGDYRAFVSDAWGVALVGAAALLCPPETDDRSVVDGRDELLHPTEQTKALIGSAVVGHRRTLSEGRSASAEQRDIAGGLGIRLGPNQTWVRAHNRGLTPDTVLRFHWRPRSPA
ncbi:MAG: hypothetical protein ACLP50_33920 [Solirubrobacteraceae bacterium]